MSGKKNKRRMFLEQLGKALVTPCIERRERLPTQKPLQPLWKLFRELNLVLNHLRLQLGQSKEKGASSATGRRTARQKLCAAQVRNTSAKPVRTYGPTCAK